MKFGFGSTTSYWKVEICSSSYLPVTVFSEVAQSDTTEHASQSVPMVSTSTPGAAGAGEERDDVFLEPDTDR